MKIKAFLKNISYTLTSNLISFLISALVTFLVPKFLGVDSYGYFQLYIFFSSYIGFLHFGWADGLYLRYGGDYYEQLNRPKFSGQFWSLTFTETIFSIILGIVAFCFVAPEEKMWVVLFTSLAIVILLPRTMLQYILQCTNRIKENAIIVTLERVVYFVMIIIVLLLREYSFVLIITADIVGKLVALVYALFSCRDIVRVRPESISNIIAETKINISVGIKLMLSNIASMLILGIIRFSIENQWDVATFGKVSLSLSISNMLMIFVNAVSLVLFPMLRRSENDDYARIYKCLNCVLEVSVLGFMILYYPLRWGLSLWIPQYSGSLVYMAVLFPMCVFESKNSMLLVTYMKTLRKEKSLLLINIVTMMLSAISTVVTIYLLKDLDLAILTIVFLVAFRSIVSEIYLSKFVKIDIVKNIITELAVVAVFIVSSWTIGGMKSAVIYICTYCLYIVVKKREIKEVYKILKK